MSDRDEKADRPDDLDRMIKKFFEIIPSYYDERQADEIRKLILKWLARRCEIQFDGNRFTGTPEGIRWGLK